MAVPLSRKIGNDILRIGWVGVRGYGRRLWDLVKDLDQLKISLCFHPNAQVAEDAAAIMKCRPCSSYDDLIDSDKIDANSSGVSAAKQLIPSLNIVPCFTHSLCKINTHP